MLKLLASPGKNKDFTFTGLTRSKFLLIARKANFYRTVTKFLPHGKHKFTARYGMLVVRNPPDFWGCQYGWNPDFHVLHGCTMMEQCASHVSIARYCPFCTFCNLVLIFVL